MTRRRIAPAIAVLASAGALAYVLYARRAEIIQESPWALAGWAMLLLAWGAAMCYLAVSNRKMRESRVQFEAKMGAELAAMIAADPPARPHAACICPKTAAGLDLCDRCPGRTP